MRGSALVNAAFAELHNLLSGTPEREKVVRHGLMISKFLITERGVNLLSVSGDVHGVTGYTAEEFKGKDAMSVLGLNKQQVLTIVTRTEATGFCLKKTKFKQKNGKTVNVISLMLKIADNQYKEFTTLEGQMIEL